MCRGNCTSIVVDATGWWEQKGLDSATDLHKQQPEAEVHIVTCAPRRTDT